MAMPTLEDILRDQIKELEEKVALLTDELNTEKIYSEFWKDKALKAQKKLREYIDKLRNKTKLCNCREREAKKYCSQLGEIRIKFDLERCSKCPDEDTYKCTECNK